MHSNVNLCANIFPEHGAHDVVNPVWSFMVTLADKSRFWRDSSWLPSCQLAHQLGINGIAIVKEHSLGRYVLFVVFLVLDAVCGLIIKVAFEILKVFQPIFALEERPKFVFR